MNRPKIGIVAWKTGENSIGITAPYYDYFDIFGDVKALFPNEGVDSSLDLLVLPGGTDISPMRYGQVPQIFTSNPDGLKEFFDINRLPGYIEAKIPVFGICRGIQALCVWAGGELIQSANHPFYSDPRTELVHFVSMINSKGEKSNKFKVNSMHHQCINPDCAGKDIIVILKAEDGTIEGIKHKELKIAGVQFHPEEIYERFSSSIIEQLLKKD